MSPNNPGNFVNDLVEMAKAFEALPKVQAELEQAQTHCGELAQTIQDRELSILGMKSEIELLNSRIRTLEVDRDHAETMFLEADDRTARALDFIKATFGNAGSLIQALEPPAPVRSDEELHKVATEHPDANERTHANNELATRQGVDAQPQGQSASPLPSHSEASSSLTEMSHGSPEPLASPSPAPEVAPAHPTVSSSSPPSYAPDAQSETAENETSVSPPLIADQSFSMPPQSPGRYSGRIYSEVAKNSTNLSDIPTKTEWLDNGGTEDNWWA